MSFQSVFTSNDIQSILSGNGASETIPSQGMVGYYLINRTGTPVYIQDDAGHTIDIVFPWFMVTGNVDDVSKNLKVVALAGDPLITSQAYPTGLWSVSVNLTADALPNSQTPIAPTIAGNTNVIISGTPAVTVTGTVNVAIVGNPTVNIGNTPSVTISGTPNINITGPVSIQNVANGLISVSIPNFNLGSTSYTAPITNVQIDSEAVGTDTTGFCYVFTSSTITNVLVTGALTGAVYFNAPVAANTPYVFAVPNSASETGIVVKATDTGSGSKSLTATRIRVPITNVPQNYGNAPLSVVPAAGSSLSAVPGTSPSSQVTVQNSGLALGSVQLGSTFTKPSTLSDLTAILQISFTAVNSLPQIVQIGLRGQTSGTTIWFASDDYDSPTTAVIAYPYKFNRHWDYPLSLANLFPSDSQLAVQVQYSLSGSVSAVAGTASLLN